MKAFIERYRVMGNRLVVRQCEARTKTDGGIFLPDQAQQKPQVAEVVAAGTGTNISPGRKVVYSPFSGTPYQDVTDGQLYLILDVEDVLLVME